jgi:DNA topoisomerase-3
MFSSTSWYPASCSVQYLRIPGERIMKLAEELYQAGFISYPRTETNQFDSQYDLQV